MFGIFGVNGLSFQGRLEQLPVMRPVTRPRAVDTIGEIGSADAEAGAPAAGSTPRGDSAAVAAYRRMLLIDKERGPLVHARQIMQPKVITVGAGEEVAKAWRTLSAHRIHQAPVLDAGGSLVGIVSERDLLTAFNLDHDEVRDALARRVADVMTSPVVAADPLTDIRRIALVMLEREVDGVPIVNARQALVGFISRGDVLRAVVTEPPLSLWR